MSNEDVVVLDDEAKAPTPKPEPKPEVEKPSAKLGKEFFDRFGGKAPHYRLAGTFNIHDLTREQADNCRLFDTWMKPKRKGMSVEFAEQMRKLGKLVRLELPWDD